MLTVGNGTCCNDNTSVLGNGNNCRTPHMLLADRPIMDLLAPGTVAIVGVCRVCSMLVFSDELSRSALIKRTKCLFGCS